MFEREMALIDLNLRDFLKSNVPPELYDPCTYLPMAGGKRLRPLLAMMCCGDEKKALPLAVSLEILHNFTLLHDDIMDKDPLRRGIKTAHNEYGEPLAILAGDTLFALAFENVSRSYEAKMVSRIIREMSNMTVEICHGQALDMLFEERRDLREEDYLTMVYKKTAIFFEKAALCGGIAGEACDKDLNRLADMGKNLGIGFQIWDDLLDLVGDENRIGKMVGSDIRRRKRTLIAIKASRSDPRIASMLEERDMDAKKLGVIMELINSSGAIDAVKSMARNFFKEAKRCAPSEELIRFIEHLEERDT